MASTSDILGLLSGSGDRGYDPYNHVGKVIRRHEAVQRMKADLSNKVFVMDKPMYQEFYKQILAEYKHIGPKYLGIDYGVRPETAIFPIDTIVV